MSRHWKQWEKIKSLYHISTTFPSSYVIRPLHDTGVAATDVITHELDMSCPHKIPDRLNSHYFFIITKGGKSYEQDHVQGGAQFKCCRGKTGALLPRENTHIKQKLGSSLALCKFASNSVFAELHSHDALDIWRRANLITCFRDTSIGSLNCFSKKCWHRECQRQWKI